MSVRVAAINWDNCKHHSDGSYDLMTAARMTGCKITREMDHYLTLVEDLRPVTSRQLAALAIATALAIYQRDDGDNGNG